MADTPFASSSDTSSSSVSLEQRLDSLGAAWGGSSDPEAFSATARAGAAPAVGAEFVRAVAARRTATLVKMLLAAGGVAGVAAVIVVMAMRVPPVPAPVVPAVVREPEPTFWNLRPGVQDPGGLDPLTGTIAEPPKATGMGAPDATGVSPGAWPADVMPRE